MAAPNAGVDAVLKRLDAIDEKQNKTSTALAEVTKSVEDIKTQPDLRRSGVIPGAPAGIVGRIPMDGAGYSILKMAGFCLGKVQAEEVKYELEVSKQLKNIFHAEGWRPEVKGNQASILVPFAVDNLPRGTSASDRLVGELKMKMMAGAAGVDPEEVGWIQKKLGRNNGMVQKDLGVISDTQGAVLLGFPTLGELVDLQRNMEVFPRAGATDMPLPPNGRLQLPKLTAATTAFWVGAGATISESTNSTGYLDLEAKKLAILTDIQNELIRFASISAEAMIRTDMAKVGALAADLAMLEGTGGTTIKGLANYESYTAWTPNTDKLIAYTVTSNLLQVKDAADMEALMPDTAGEPTAWLMRRNLWAKLRNRRADAITAADNAGPYLADITRSLSTRMSLEWDGTPVVRSSQISNTRGSGAQTYVILGYFPDWIIARFGVMEFLMSNTSDTALTTDITRLRAIQHLDAGARHASSFVFADSITIS